MRTTYVNELFNTLLSQPWSAEYEDEAFTLLGQLSDAEDAGQKLLGQVDALHRLTDRMIEARKAQRMKAVEHPEKLTRVALKKKQDEALRLARADFAERLRAAAAKEQGPLAAWIKVERGYLDTRLGQNLKQVAAECWEALGAAPKAAPDADEDPPAGQRLEEALRSRYLVTLMHLAVQKGADLALVERLHKYLERGAALADESAPGNSSSTTC